MNLFEIDEAIENFNFIEDEETGEILNINELENLQMERDKKIENIALYVKNLKSDAKAIDDEIKIMQKRRDQAKKKAESLTNYLDRILNGEKFKSSKVVVNYRKSTKVDIYDNKAFENWANANDPNLLKVETTTKPIKKAIMDELKNGKQIIGVRLESNRNISIK